MLELYEVKCELNERNGDVKRKPNEITDMKNKILEMRSSPNCANGRLNSAKDDWIIETNHKEVQSK